MPAGKKGKKRKELWTSTLREPRAKGQFEPAFPFFNLIWLVCQDQDGCQKKTNKQNNTHSSARLLPLLMYRSLATTNGHARHSRPVSFEIGSDSEMGDPVVEFSIVTFSGSSECMRYLENPPSNQKKKTNHKKKKKKTEKKNVHGDKLLGERVRGVSVARLRGAAQGLGRDGDVGDEPRDGGRDGSVEEDLGHGLGEGHVLLEKDIVQAVPCIFFLGSSKGNGEM
jgi:hypothetical protein